MEKFMLISELAKEAGLTKDTVRYYTKLGLIQAESKEAGSRTYAIYNKDSIQRIEEIQLAKSAGFTLSEIRAAIVEYNEGKLTTRRMIELYKQKLEDVRIKQEELNRAEEMLLFKINKYSKK